MLIACALPQTREEMSELPAVDPDALLARRAAAGDALAFEQLYRRHAGRILAVTWRLAGGVRARAEELMQDAFVRAWQALPGFRHDSSFATWLQRLAVNVALMDLRARRSREDREDDDSGLEAAAAPLRRGDLQLDLEAAVARLPPRARAVLVLHDIEGWKHHEIGEQLGMAVGSSKAQLHRARQLLRHMLGEDS